MSELHTTKCDGRNCTQVKAEANNWLKMVKLDGHFSVWRADSPSEIIVPSGHPVLDFCSPACALNACAMWMERPATAPELLEAAAK